MAEPARRRRRVRPASESSDSTESAGAEPADAGYARAETSPVADAPVVGVVDLPVEVDADITPSERGLRGLVGGGSSQIKPAAALRARDAARPRPEDLERAEAELAIVRRHWTPRE